MRSTGPTQNPYFKSGQAYCRNAFNLARTREGINQKGFTFHSSENDLEFLKGVVAHFSPNDDSTEFFFTARRNIVPHKMALKLIDRMYAIITHHQYSQEQLLSIPNFIAFMDFLVKKAQEFVKATPILSSQGIIHKHSGDHFDVQNSIWQAQVTNIADFFSKFKQGDYHPSENLKRKTWQFETVQPQANPAEDAVSKPPFKKARIEDPTASDTETQSPVAAINQFGVFSSPIKSQAEIRRIKQECEEGLVEIIVKKYRRANGLT